MEEPLLLGPTEILEERAFTHPENSREDLLRMRRMARQLVDTYDDPLVCDFVPGKGALCQSDPQGRHFRIYYIQPNLLFSRKNLAVVGFFGHKRSDAEIKPLIRADKEFEKEFHRHSGLLSLSTVRLPHGDFSNLVVFTDPESRDKWNNMPLHRDLVARISPPYYEYVRLNRAVLPDGLEDPDSLRILAVRYLDYRSDEPWRAVRNLV